MEYEDRIVCFLDILNFKGLVKETIGSDGKDNTNKIKSLNELILLAQEILEIEEKYELSKSKVVTHFSDSIVISFKVDERSEVFYTLLEILHLILNFLNKGVLVRGGITYGKLVHTGKVLFGPGLIEAYQLESKAALYPRVILDSSIIEMGKNTQLSEILH